MSRTVFRIGFRGVLALALYTLFICPLAAVQEGSSGPKQKETFDPKTTSRITLGGTSGTPGEAVVVPIYFTPAEGTQAGTLKIQVNFVSANLKFGKIERGIAAETGNIELASDRQTSKNDKGVETSTVTIAAKVTSPDSKKGIPSGLLGYMTLNISEQGRPAVITLRASGEGTALGSNKPLQNLRAVEASVEVLAPGTQPAVACFFFNH